MVYFSQPDKADTNNVGADDHKALVCPLQSFLLGSVCKVGRLSFSVVGAAGLSNHRRIMARAILASFSANVWPMQIRGPQLNGRNIRRFLVAFATPSENLSGLNLSASSPQRV
ncbi:hypothetical protein EJ110_NYTH02551 [Nymphaea thermarum]|nr:hypothetical protein EJ110_NYTH02551 [Nymphaea thermarum]